MLTLSSRPALVAAAVLGLGGLALAAALALRPGDAAAQGLMAAPACQCSAPTVIPGLSTSLVHCLCGGMSCVVAEQGPAGKGTGLMQCVR